MAKWSLDLSKYAKARKEQIKDVQRGFAFNLYSSIVKKTPVDTGRARGNWNISPDKDDTTVKERTTPQYTSKEQVKAPSGDGSIFISNNVPYICKLEYGGYPNPPKKGNGKTTGGYSTQAPEGMVGVAMANAEEYMKQAVAQSEKENK